MSPPICVSRYVPKDRPSAQSFEVEGMMVDMASSSHNTVIITSVTRDTAGTVMCEVRALIRPRLHPLTLTGAG